MKTLAIVTMFFLPGSFISALFSAPFFAWDELNNRDYRHIGVRTTPQFNLYWAITIPITVLTFILYFSWVFYQKYSRSRGDPTLNEKATPTQPPLAANNNMNNVPIRISSEAERHKLSRRRATLLAGYSKEV
jgi:hypothetical protein